MLKNPFQKRNSLSASLLTENVNGDEAGVLNGVVPGSYRKQETIDEEISESDSIATTIPNDSSIEQADTQNLCQRIFPPRGLFAKWLTWGKIVTSTVTDIIRN